MRFRLRTLLIVLALGPPVLAGTWWFGWGVFHAWGLGIEGVAVLVITELSYPELSIFG